MSRDDVRSYISNLPIGPFQVPVQTQEDVTAVDIDNLPKGIVTGSNLIQFPDKASPEVRTSVALSLLLAQRVAFADNVIKTPDQWIDCHNTVLRKINWLVERGGTVDSQVKGLDVAVHKAIIPFLTAVLGPAVAVGSLIIAALNSLQSMNQNLPWITLFDQQSRRFDVSEYMFSVVDMVDDQVHLSMASARFNASFGSTQVLFFKLSNEQAQFQSVSESLSAQADLLTDLNGDLKTRLASRTQSFIKSLPDNLGA